MNADAALTTEHYRSIAGFRFALRQFLGHHGRRAHHADGRDQGVVREAFDIDQPDLAVATDRARALVRSRPGLLRAARWLREKTIRVA